MDEMKQSEIDRKQRMLDNFNRELDEIEQLYPINEKKIELLETESDTIRKRSELVLNNYVSTYEKKWKFEELPEFVELSKTMERIGFEKQQIAYSEQMMGLLRARKSMEEQREQLSEGIEKVEKELEELKKSD